MTDFPVKILVFFTRNPDEILSIDDAAEKWNVKYTTAQTALFRLEKSGWVRRLPSKQRSSLYEIGPTLEAELK